MASNRYAQVLAEVQSSPIAGCIQPSEPYHHRAVVTLLRWRALENMGCVRLICEDDPDYDPREFDEPTDSEAYGSIGEFMIPDIWEDGSVFIPDIPVWHNADSVWGHVGYRNVLDWRENAYILDIMDSTIDAFREAWKASIRKRQDIRQGLCAACHGTGRN